MIYNLLLEVHRGNPVDRRLLQKFVRERLLTRDYALTHEGLLRIGIQSHTPQIPDYADAVRSALQGKLVRYRHSHYAENGTLAEAQSYLLKADALASWHAGVIGAVNRRLKKDWSDAYDRCVNSALSSSGPDLQRWRAYTNMRKRSALHDIAQDNPEAEGSIWLGAFSSVALSIGEALRTGTPVLQRECTINQSPFGDILSKSGFLLEPDAEVGEVILHADTDSGVEHE